MEGRVCIFLFPLSSDLHMESFFLFPFSFLALYKQINTITSFLCIFQTLHFFLSLLIAASNSSHLHMLFLYTISASQPADTSLEPPIKRHNVFQTTKNVQRERAIHQNKDSGFGYLNPTTPLSNHL